MGSLVRPFLQHFPHQESGNQRTSVEEINLQEVYGFFTSDEVAQQFVIMLYLGGHFSYPLESLFLLFGAWL